MLILFFCSFDVRMNDQIFNFASHTHLPPAPPDTLEYIYFFTHSLYISYHKLSLQKTLSLPSDITKGSQKKYHHSHHKPAIYGRPAVTKNMVYLCYTG